MANLIYATSNKNYFQFHGSHYKYEKGVPQCAAGNILRHQAEQLTSTLMTAYTQIQSWHIKHTYLSN